MTTAAFLNTAECKDKNINILDVSGKYVKSICLVPRGNKFLVARKYCWSHGMSLFKPNTKIAHQNLISYINRRYPQNGNKKKGFFFIDNGASQNPKLCKTVNNFGNSTRISMIPCNKSGWFICEYIDPEEPGMMYYFNQNKLKWCVNCQQGSKVCCLIRYTEKAA